MGWNVLPIRRHDAPGHGAGKAPGIRGWNQWAAYEAPGATLADIRSWERQDDSWPGTGIACGSILVVDIDFATDAQLAASMRALALEIFGPTPFERQGRAPKIALVYRAAEQLPSVRLKCADGSGDGIDLLADGSQLVAYGIHPATGQPYAWIGAEAPLTASPEAAPEVTQEQMHRFLGRLQAQVELSRTGGRKARGGGRIENREIVRNGEGRVCDGRELHLTRLTYKMAVAMVAEDLALNDAAVDGLAERAWASFSASTVLEDGRWSYTDAVVKARALIARIACGQLRLTTPPRTIDPTYSDGRISTDEAEVALARIVDGFFETHVADWVQRRDCWSEMDQIAKAAGGERPEKPLPVSWGVRIETAIGKTEKAIQGAVEAARAGLTVAFAVPTHRLGSEIEERFASKGVKTRVYRAYDAPDPQTPGTRMCLDLPAVQDAREAGVSSVTDAVCERRTKGGEIVRCPFLDQCGVTRQRRDTPSIWIVPHALLLAARPAFIPQPDAIVVDEGIVMTAIPDRPVAFTLDALERSDVTQNIAVGVYSDAANDLSAIRGRLLQALREQKEDGPLSRRLLIRHGLTESLTAEARALEWRRLIDPAIQPGMDPKVRRTEAAITGHHNSEVKRWAGIWAELRAFLATDAEYSGRLSLRYDHESQARVLDRRSLDTVPTSWAAPMLLLDATLPAPALVEAILGHEVELRADISARWSAHVTVRQIAGAPVSAEKLGIVEGREAEKPRRAIADLLRLIRLRAALVDQRRTVVVVGPKGLIDLLLEAGLPPNVECAHFGAVAGIDRWASAAGLICIGRLLPGPRTVEAMAGVITGRLPEIVPDAALAAAELRRMVWYEPRDCGVRLASGSGFPVRHYHHPDPIAEALRWQICEANLIQAIGRLRPLRRNGASPCFLDIISDVPLPISVDEAVPWDEASVGLWADMAMDGILLSSPADAEACFPELAPSRKAARGLCELTLALTPIRDLSIGVRANVTAFEYKRAGRFRPTRAVALPNRPRDIKTWLFDRLGAIEWIRMEGEQPSEAAAPRSAARRVGDSPPALSIAGRKLEAARNWPC